MNGQAVSLQIQLSLLVCIRTKKINVRRIGYVDIRAKDVLVFGGCSVLEVTMASLLNNTKPQIDRAR